MTQRGDPNHARPEEGADPSVARISRYIVSEDWAATIVGLGLLALVLLGIIGKGMIP